MSSDLRVEIKKHYASHATNAAQGLDRCGCHGEAIGKDLYPQSDLRDLSAEVVRAAAGCGNPTALASLHPGENVLDLGSGGGIDAFLAAKRVGPQGMVYGLDMTPEMLQIARQNADSAGVKNVEFLQGEIEHIPLPDSTVDVILSNCVINLSLDKDQVFREAIRTLKPGGRLAISDMIFVGDRGLLPSQIRDSLAAWASCVAGALEINDYTAKLLEAGFEDVSIQITQEYNLSDLEGSCCGSASSSCCGPSRSTSSCCASPTSEGVKLVSGFVRAHKPNPQSRMLPVAVEHADAADISEIYGLLSQYHLPLEGITDHLTNFLVVKQGGQIVGVGGLEVYGNNALLRSLAVTQSRQGTGVGRTLVQALIDLAGSLGIEQLVLLTTTAEDYFPRWGFQRITRQDIPLALHQSVEFQEACPATATVMSLHMTA